ncbi:integrator complex subunit 12 [Toxorhynchites rutilus septentrionalis]|uniref:integrator complex subunit 12 n=1 Tax=Toxorhynchites rutilus septentrionalis TaxID=329112 RepID=UPI0024790ACF|nr:integrator complex subunit 12 [Toxorhynchites rutilus septentrionalis]
MMSSALDVDPTFKHALKLLHSDKADSAEKIRSLLDEVIKQRHGSGKTLASTLTKKHLAEESLALGSNLYVRKQKPIVTVVDAVASVSICDSNQQSPAKSEPPTESSVPTPESLTVPPPQGAIILSISDVEGNDDDDEVVMEEDQLKELEDLMCIVCRRMDVSARNRLVECADCHSLYHQECHKPVISEVDANDQENAWFCTICRGKSLSKSSSSSAVGSPARTSSSSHSKSSSSGSVKNNESSSSSHRHKRAKSGSSRESSSHDRDREREKDRDRDRDRERDRDRDRSEKGDREKDRDKSKSSSGSGSSSSIGAGGSASSAALSSSSGAGTPNINIISADKRLQMMKKKAAKLQDSKRKHK